MSSPPPWISVQFISQQVFQKERGKILSTDGQGHRSTKKEPEVNCH